MDKKNIIKLLEQKYIENVAKMDATKDQNKKVLYATMSCEIAEMLAKINGLGYDEQSQQLFNKYNLWKFDK